jgi:hypothetical protein
VWTKKEEREGREKRKQKREKKLKKKNVSETIFFLAEELQAKKTQRKKN